MNADTLAVHGGIRPDPSTGAVMTPVYFTSTFAQEKVGVHKGFDYSRTDNPTRTALQESLGLLEGGKALAFSSGMSAIDTVLRLVRPGEEVLVGNDVYGGTFRLFEKVLRGYGISFKYADISETEKFASAVSGRTALVWLETPTNPLLRLGDIFAISKIAKERNANAIVAVDNTFATPILQRPLDLGADLVVHSTTKYINGHSDVVGGAIVAKEEGTYARLKFLQNAIGAVPGPMDSFLTLRGIKTLSLRMRKHSENALKVAKFLEGRREVKRVVYPFLESNPQYPLARRQMALGGGMVSVEMESARAARKFAEGTRLFTLAESLGGVESLIEVPSQMTHASTAGSGLEVSPALVRLSVGIEDAQDLIEDLKVALGRI